MWKKNILFILCLLPFITFGQIYGPYNYSSGVYSYSLKSTFSSIWGGSAMQWQIDIQNNGSTPINMHQAAIWMNASLVPSFNNYAALGGVSWPSGLQRNVINDVPNSIYQDTIIMPSGSWVVNNLAPGNIFSMQYTFNVASISNAEQLSMAQLLQFYAYTWPQPSLYTPIVFHFSGSGGNAVNVHTKKSTATSYIAQTISDGDTLLLSNNSSYSVYAENFSVASTLYSSVYTAISPLIFSTLSSSTVNLPFSSSVIPVANLPISISGLPNGATSILTLTGSSYPISYQIIIGNGDTSINQLPVDNYQVSVTRYVNESTNKIASPCFQTNYTLSISPTTLVIHFSECNIEAFGVPGWPKYLAMGTVTQPAISMDAGLQAAPIDAIFKYSGNDGAGDRGLSYLTNTYLQNASIATILQSRRLEQYYDSAYNMPGFKVMPVMVHYTANASGGGSVGAAPDILDSTNLRIHYINLINETQIMLSYKDSTHPYPGTLIISPDLLGALQQDNSSQNTFPPYNYNNPSNFNANILKSKVYVNQKLAEAFAACGLSTSNLPSFTDSLKGYFQSINYLVHEVGLNSILLGWQENLWSTGSANWIHTSTSATTVGQQVVDFLKDSLQVFTGTYKPDFFVIDRYERDCFSPGTSGSYAYNANKWQKTLNYAGHIAKGINLPLMLWQFPGGHLVHKDSAIVNYDLINHASACGTWFFGETSIGSNLNNIKSTELNISIPPGNYYGASTVQQLLLQDGGYNWGQSNLQAIAQTHNVFAILWGGGSTTSVSNIGTNGYDDGWLANKIRDYHAHSRVYKTDSLCNLDDSTISIKIHLQGYYNNSGMMSAVLMNQGMGNDVNVTDTITLELHNENFPHALVASQKIILHTDGSAFAKFPSSLSGNYYIVIKHRNSIPTWSSVPISLGLCAVNYNFSLGPNKAYGSNQVQVEPNVWAFYSGDVYSDENIDLLDASILENDINNFQFGYYKTDINGDGNVDLLDLPILELNVNNFIYSMHP